MSYSLACDTCDFVQSVEEESRAYGVAKGHESEYPDHFVIIEYKV